MGHVTLPIIDEKGFVLLRPYRGEIPEAEFREIEFMNWKSGGDTRFSPITSANGEMDCNGFWHTDGKHDKDGVWTRVAEHCPTLVEWATRVGANYGRVRVIELNPNTLEQAHRWLHQDDNNRTTEEGTGWVVRAWLQLTDNPDSYMILRDAKDDEASEQRIYLNKGAQFVVDSERLFHGVFHPGPGPRYALIVSFESCPELEAWIRSELPETSASYASAAM